MAETTSVWKEIDAQWDGYEGYIGRNKAGSQVLMGKGKDGQPGVSPMEILLIGLAGCTMMDIVDILRKKRQMPVDFKVKVRGRQRTEIYPMFYTEFELEYLLWGEDIRPKDLEQAIQLSEEKYCSVGGTLTKAGPIRSSYRILKPGQGVEEM